jgi:2-iminobutanoate/2-iminopropanoate deaminase
MPEACGTPAVTFREQIGYAKIREYTAKDIPRPARGMYSDGLTLYQNNYNNRGRMMQFRLTLVLTGLGTLGLAGCHPGGEAEAPEYFQLRPDVEAAYGYTHAVRLGDDLKVSGAVSMDAAGNPTAIGDMEQQMKNVYADLEAILTHYGYTFDDVVVENAFTTDMAQFLTIADYRTSIYKKQFPTGTWLEVKGLALPEFMIEIEIEAHKAH